MRKIFSALAVGVLASLLILPSCKKTTHETRPTPNNIRVLSYTVIDSAYLHRNAAPDTTYTLNENYRFYYDESKRVSRILYTTNNGSYINQETRFTYKGDSIFRTRYDVGTQNILERDTFVLNSDGMLRAAYTPGTYGLTRNFKYYGKLMSNEELIARDTMVTMSANSTYTSVDGDWLRHYLDGTLSARFDKLVASNGTYSYTLDTVWWYAGNFTTLLATHSRINSLTDVLNSYQGQYITVVGKDAYGNMDTGTYPGIWYSQAYEFYTKEDSLQRPGDYLQLQAFTFYGMNNVQNKHLVKKITTPGRITTVSYNIDADSKIKQAFVTVKDSALNTHTMKYDIQYEIF